MSRAPSLFCCPSFQSSDLPVPLFPLPPAKLFYYYFHSSFLPGSSLDPSLEYYCSSKHFRALGHPELPSGTLWVLQRVSYLAGTAWLPLPFHLLVGFPPTIIHFPLSSISPYFPHFPFSFLFSIFPCFSFPPFSLFSIFPQMKHFWVSSCCWVQQQCH